MISIASLTALASAGIHLESGQFKASLTHVPKPVVFNSAFDTAPSTFAGVISYSGTHAAIPVSQKITTTGAEFFVDEPICFDGNHMRESLDWMALDDGTHKTDEGKPFVVGRAASNKGTVTAGAAGQWTKVTYPGTFTGSVAVVVNAQSSKQVKKDAKWYNVRVQNVNANGFEFHVENDPQLNKADAADGVVVSYLVIETGEGHINNYQYNALVTPNKHIQDGFVNVASPNPGDVGYSSLLESGTKPLVFGSVTHSGSDTASLRMKYAANGKIQFAMKEPDNKECGWDGVHPMAEQAYLFLVSPTKFECDAVACHDWDCSQWCRCFDEHEETLYTNAGCDQGDGSPCEC